MFKHTERYSFRITYVLFEMSLLLEEHKGASLAACVQRPVLICFYIGICKIRGTLEVLSHFFAAENLGKNLQFDVYQWRLRRLVVCLTRLFQ
jgi:hypothetical protein